MEIRSFLESFPVRATEGEVFLKYAFLKSDILKHLVFHDYKKTKLYTKISGENAHNVMPEWYVPN